MFFHRLLPLLPPYPNIFSFNSLISSFLRHNSPLDAFLAFRLLLASPILRPDSFSFSLASKSSQSPLHLTTIHSLILKTGVFTDVFVSSSLVSTYSNFGLLKDAHKVFDEMPLRDSACWNAMVSAFCRNGRVNDAVRLFKRIVGEDGWVVDGVTVSTILPVFVLVDELDLVLGVHVYVVKLGFDSNVCVMNALIDVYRKFFCLGDAKVLFDSMERRDLFTWNIMISGYEQFGAPVMALELFGMMKLNRIKPDVLTLVSIVSAAAQIGDQRNCLAIHCFLLRKQWDEEDTFVFNAIIDMYGKINRVKTCQQIFDRMGIKDVVTYNTLIATYSQNGFSNEAISVYESMGLKQVQGTFVAVLPACSHVGALRTGMKIHGEIIKSGLNFDVFVATCVVDMYAKCGETVKASAFFVEMERKGIAAYNAMIAGHGMQGEGDKAMKLFFEMQKQGIKPNDVTFVSLLSACSHGGLLQQGKECFHMMKLRFGIEPMVKHYACMVDLLGRAGFLDEAYRFIESMPLEADCGVWGAFMAACRIHGNVEFGRLASKWLLEFEPGNVGYYVLSSNLYAKGGNWKDVDEIRTIARRRGLVKTPGWSSIEICGKVSVFFSGDRNHDRYGEIYRELVRLGGKMKEIGYVPDYSFVLQDVEDDEKEGILMNHSERLAIAFGIVSTVGKNALFIYKNLRVCGDCHNASKYISRIVEREIVVRDSNRFHRFKDGVCSCGDYW